MCIGLVLAPAEKVDAARVDAAAKFMQKVANELQTAGRLGSRNAFHKSIKRYADISYIGTVSLGGIVGDAYVQEVLRHIQEGER